MPYRHPLAIKSYSIPRDKTAVKLGPMPAAATPMMAAGTPILRHYDEGAAIFADMKGDTTAQNWEKRLQQSDQYGAHLDSVVLATKDPFHNINEPTVSDLDISEHKATMALGTKALETARKGLAPGDKGD